MYSKGDLYNTNSYEERISVIVGVVARPDDFNQVDEDETNVGEEEEVSLLRLDRVRWDLYVCI